MARKPFLLRIEEKLLREIEKWAHDELRSVNGQIEYLLRQAVLGRRRRELGGPGRPGGDGPRGGPEATPP